MSDRISPSVFLERRSYRRRRMMDALRLLPLLGIILFLLPILWPTAPFGTVQMSRAVIYVFSAWLALICASALLWRSLWRDVKDEDTDDDTQDDVPS